ncbi:MAG: hypothetical protein ABJC26_09845 [Gemmatimonadaceae bacterium]
MKRIIYMLSGLFAVAAVSAASNEVYAERTMAKSASSCGSYNWCAAGPGQGDIDCDACCGGSGGFCYDYRDIENFQGCLCL